MPQAKPAGDQPRAFPSDSTAGLLARARRGDDFARNRLVGRYLPLLLRWAHGRLPPHARELLDTDDLVQVTLVRALDKIGEFEPQHEGAFLAYLRTILVNLIRDEIRRARVRPGRQHLEDSTPDTSPTPLEELIGKETIEQYEDALATLSRDHQEAVVLRLEFGFTYQQVAEAMERRSSEAARQLVARALVHLARRMDARS